MPLVTEAAKKYDIKGALVLPPLPPGDITSGVLEFIHQLTTMDYDALVCARRGRRGQEEGWRG